MSDAIASNAQLNAVGITDIASFATKFKSSATGGGVDYITNTLVPSIGNADTGSLLGSDRASSLSLTKPVLNNEDVVDESPFGTITTDSLTSFTEIWPTSAGDTGKKLKILVGANSSQSIELSQVDVRTTRIGIDSVDVTSNADLAITKFEAAIETVSSYRSTFGAIQNRLERVPCLLVTIRVKT